MNLIWLFPVPTILMLAGLRYVLGILDREMRRAEEWEMPE